MIAEEIRDALKPFTDHHLNLRKGNAQQVTADCPFCGKEGHFYVNPKNRLWDCKVCGARGNMGQYLYMIHRMYMEYLEDPKNEHLLAKLSADRKLPISAIKAWKLGYDPSRDCYCTPVFDGTESLCDIKKYKIGKKSYSTPGTSTGLFNRMAMINKKTVYLCEGEWDGMAMDWLLKTNGIKDACAVAVSGAMTFKNTWIPFFNDKEVYCMYDHDGAGEKGQLVVRNKLTGMAKSLRYIHWPDNFPTGFDVRDWIKYGIRVKKPKACYRNLMQLISKDPQRPNIEDPEAPTVDEVKQEQERLPLKPDLTNEELYDIYRKWLYMPDTMVLDIMFGTIFANRLSGDPVWMFFVAPPAGSKSELLMSLSWAEECYPLTSLTPHALVSGTAWGDGKDPSLLPKLDKKVLVLKDFTTILSMNYTARDEIFGILRDIYDGRTEKSFGNGLKREYKCKFGILAGVTPVIEAFSAMNQSLGERFLRYRLPLDTKESEEQKILKAISNVNNEIKMRAELCQASASVLTRKNPDDEVLPHFTEFYIPKVVALAQLSAWLRGVVDRDRYTQQVLYKPSSEVGTRMAKQLVKLAMGIGIFRGTRNLEFYEYSCIRNVAIDSCPQRVVMILTAMYKALRKEDYEMLKTKDISDRTNLPQSTVLRIMEDLNLLQIVKRTEVNGNYYWRISPELLKLADRSGAFSRDDMTKEPVKRKIKKVKRK